MRVLAVEPYFGGSHQAFLDNVSVRSAHQWLLATLPARHWKWRMRSAPVELVRSVVECVDPSAPPDIILASDMLDVPTWLGMMARNRDCDSWIRKAPLVCYFHENQWAYPTAPNAREDHHFAFTNLLSAAVCNECWFNSEFNRRTFLEGSKRFLDRMPDYQNSIDLDAIADASRVISPGFATPRQRDDGSVFHSPLRLGWVGRFEHDKRPDRFLELLDLVAARGIDFELILLGARGRSSESLDVIADRHRNRIVFNDYAEDRAVYDRWLGRMDIVVSTADHEFFGIAICEAIWAGAIPLVPDRLSYVEFIPECNRYGSLDQAAEMIAVWESNRDCGSIQNECRQRIAGFEIGKVTKTIDDRLVELTHDVA